MPARDYAGLSPRSFDFLFELSVNNERAWFKAHKEEFDRVLGEPFSALARETCALMQERFPQEDLRLHVARIYRDARRLFGRGPYKDNLWFSLQKGETRSVGPMLWFEIDTEGYSHGMGSWDRSPEEAALFRRAIDAEPERFLQLVQALPDRDRLRLWGETYKRPKAQRGPVLDPWYNRKTLSVGYSGYFGQDVYSPQLPALLTESFAQLMPMYRFFLQVHETARQQEDLL